MNYSTNYQLDLERLQQEITTLEDEAFAEPVVSEKATRYAYYLYQRASLTGDLEALAAAEAALNRAFQYVRNPADLYFLKAQIAFKLHQLSAVKDAIAQSPTLRESFSGHMLQADLLFQEGCYNEAKARYESLLREEPTWDGFARLAHLQFKLGEIEAADQLYLAAEDELTAKEMRHFAWVELQRGLLDLARGQYQDVEVHYQRADRAYSDYWVVDEHRAELYGAQGEFAEAIRLYEKVLAQVPRPELKQALGELYLFMDRPAQAQPWLEQALDAFLASARRGEVHYYHHLADFYSDVCVDSAEAVKWAQHDLALRENFATQAGLAWALYRAGQFLSAREWIEKALASGVQAAHLFSQAATIFEAAGDVDQGKEWKQKAVALNPHYQQFHVHR